MARTARSNPTKDDVLHQCGLCSHLQCGLAHIIYIIYACPHLTHARDGARSDLWIFATRQPPTPTARVMQRYTQLLFEHPNLDQRGQLWLGHWTPSLRQVPLLQSLTLREGQAALARIGRRATEIYRDLWDCYGEAIACSTPSSGARLQPGHASSPVHSPNTALCGYPSLFHDSTPLGCSASCRPRLVLHTPPLCSGGECQCLRHCTARGVPPRRTACISPHVIRLSLLI